MTSEVFNHALSTLLKKGSHLIEILQAIIFIWLHTCLPFRTNQFTWGVFNNVSNGGTLDVLVPGFTHCKYVALSTNAHLAEHALGLKFHWPTQSALKAMWKPTLPFLTSVHLTYTTPPLNSSSQPIPYLYPILPLTNHTPPTLPYSTQPHLPLPENPTHQSYHILYSLTMTQPHLPHPENPTLTQGTYPTLSYPIYTTLPYTTLSYLKLHYTSPH